MQNFNVAIEDNTGSIAQLWYIPVEDVEYILLPVNHIIPGSVTLVSGKSWFSGEISKESAGFEEKPVELRGSKGRSISFSAFVPGHSAEITSLFMQMELRKFIVVVEDYDGNKRLIGSLKNPMRFKFSFETGSKTSSLKGYTISFYHTTRISPFFFYDYESYVFVWNSDGGNSILFNDTDSLKYK